MRQVGIAENQPEAHRFASYLVTKGIAAHAEEESDGWAVWVRDEDHFDEARDEFQQFRDAPQDSRYQGAEQEAEAIIREQVRQRAQAKNHVVEMRGRWKRPATRRAPLTFALIGVCVLVSLFTSFGKNEHWLNLSFSADLGAEDEAIFSDIKGGQVWRLVTPIFGHGNPMHLLFNCMWMFVLGSQIEHAKGSIKLGLLVLAAAIIPNSLQAGFEGPAFLGISGVVCGLFGYVWMKSLFAPHEGMYVSPITVYIFIGFLFACLFGWFGAIANVAHFAGLAVGVAAGYAPMLFKSAPDE